MLCSIARTAFTSAASSAAIVAKSEKRDPTLDLGLG
jgi:hypothetical protein